MTAAQAREPSHRAMEQAAEWYALLRSGDASAAERQQWQQWIDRAAEHREAWGYVERIGRRFSPLQSSPDRDAAVMAPVGRVASAPVGNGDQLLNPIDKALLLRQKMNLTRTRMGRRSVRADRERLPMRLAPHPNE